MLKNATLLAQSEVLGIDLKKTGQEIVVKDKSILFPYHVSNGIWTMSNHQVHSLILSNIFIGNSSL
jgi:hypothetical protein